MVNSGDTIDIMNSSNSFGIVSAYRSFVSRKENQWRSTILQNEVQSKGYSFTLLSSLCYLVADKTEYNETQSLLISDIDPETLLDLACKHRCYKVLYKHDSSLELLSMDGRLLTAYDLLPQQDNIETIKNAFIGYAGCRKYPGMDRVAITLREANRISNNKKWIEIF